MPRISVKRPTVIRVKTCHILPPSIHFHANIASHFSFLDRLAPSVKLNDDGGTILAFPTGTIQFEDARVNRWKEAALSSWVCVRV
jgi:hypothetical protein